MPSPTMLTLQRNQLAWPTQAAWQQLQACNWDAQARAVLAHWQAHRLPLVVCTQRCQQAPGMVSLGLPAPAQWDRRKLAVELPLEGLACVGPFPTLRTLVRRPFVDAEALRPLSDAMQALGLDPGVHGSFGWQALTGLDYLRPGSDLDLHMPVSGPAQAQALAIELDRLQLGVRLDGELVFPGGCAVAWREYLQWLQGAVDRVLVKTLLGAHLLDGGALADEEVACNA